MKLHLSRFLGHNADKFSLTHVLEFYESELFTEEKSESSVDKEVCGGCGNVVLPTVNRLSGVGYCDKNGFYESIDSDIDFAIYYCPKCGAWYTYIE